MVRVDPSDYSIFRNHFATAWLIERPPSNRDGAVRRYSYSNRDRDEQITFAVNADEYGHRHTIEYHSEQLSGLNLRDPEDPIPGIEARAGLEGSSAQGAASQCDIWERLRDVDGGDAGKAKATLHRLITREADRLPAAVKG
jgi:hypothetical protein